MVAAGSVLTAKTGQHFDAGFFAELEHERHDRGRVGIVLPARAARRRSRAGHEDGEFLHVEHAELGLAQAGFLQREAEHGRGAAGGDHDPLALDQARAKAFDALGLTQLRHLAVTVSV